MRINQTFHNKTAIVTGGASGIGRALCRMLAERGCIVFVTDIDIDGAESVASDIRNKGGIAHEKKLDITDEHEVFRIVDTIKDELGSVDYFFNNAGICVSGDAQDIVMHQWKKVLEVNLSGVLHGTMAAYGVMAKQGHGHIVNIASMAGFAPFSINTPYTMAKYGVVGLTNALRPEAADSGVHFTLVCPGVVHTEFYQSMEIIGADRERYNSHLPKKIFSAEMAAEKIISGVERNKKLILFPFHARLFWWMQKWAPWAIDALNLKMARQFRAIKKIDGCSCNQKGG